MVSWKPPGSWGSQIQNKYSSSFLYAVFLKSHSILCFIHLLCSHSIDTLKFVHVCTCNVTVLSNTWTCIKNNSYKIVYLLAKEQEIFISTRPNLKSYDDFFFNQIVLIYIMVISVPLALLIFPIPVYKQ